MAKIELITAGDQKFTQFKKIEDEFIKRIGHYINFSVSSVKVKNIKDEKKLIHIESEKIQKKINREDYVIALDRSGIEMSSTEFASFISEKALRNSKKIVFLIGSAAGISNDLISISDKIISFSKMTFTHDIFKIVFLEQLYRAFTIIKGQRYHR